MRVRAAYVHEYSNICVVSFVCVCISICMYVCMYVCMYACVCVRVYVSVHVIGYES